MTQSNNPMTNQDPGREARLAEERFLYAAQRAMQKLLNEKSLKYKDLARRMSVSEARVSQLFGDDAGNLTMKTVARVFHCLGEAPVIMSASAYANRIAEAEGAANLGNNGWVMSGVPEDFAIEPTTTVVDDLDLPKAAGRSATPRDWAMADAAAERRVKVA